MFRYSKKPLIYIPLLIFSGPILSNFLVWLPIPSIADNPTWLGFYGNYSGGIIGGVVAYLITKYQLNAEKQKDIENNRSFISAENITAPIRLKRVSTSPNSKIIVNDNYNELLERFGEESPVSIPFLKIQHFGIPDVILDCKIEIDMDDEGGNFAYSISSSIGVIEKGIEVYIPISKLGYKRVSINVVEIWYTTLRGEKMLYRGIFKEKKASFFVMNSKKLYNELFSFEIKNSKWMYPKKLEQTT